MSAEYLRGVQTALNAINNGIEAIPRDAIKGRAEPPGGFVRFTKDNMVHPGSNKGGSGFAVPGVKVHHGAHGEVYELKSGVPLASAVPSKGSEPDVPLDRWLAATMLGDRCEDKAALHFANETKSLSGSATGILLPQAFQGQWIDNLRSYMVLEAAGMTTATMGARTVTSSRVVSDPPVSWRAEGGSLSAGDPTFELRNLVANTLAVRVQGTAELAQDSPDFGSQLMTVMGMALAHEIDRVGLVGTGLNNQPQGIINTPGISTIASIGTPTYQDLVTGLQRLLESNVPLDRCDGNAIMSPRTWATLENLESADGQPIRRPQALNNMVFRPTTSIPNNLGDAENASLMILGDFSDLVLGVRMEASVEALRLQSFAENLMLEFVGWTRVDFMVRRPASFTVLEGVTASA